jgi:hypothetical protein
MRKERRAGLMKYETWKRIMRIIGSEKDGMCPGGEFLEAVNEADSLSGTSVFFCCVSISFASLVPLNSNKLHT